MKRYTTKDFEKQFPDDDACLGFIKNARWPNGIFCDNCKRVTKHHKITDRKVYSCDFCGTQVSPTAGTIFHKSPTPLKSWFYAIFIMASTRCGISAKQLERELGVTYKTAWRMFSQIRKLMAEDINPLTGLVEIDDTYIGGKAHGGKCGRGASKKAIVMGMVQREGNISTKVVPNLRAATINPEIRQRVTSNSVIFTDDYHGYATLGKEGYAHYKVSHADGKYTDGIIHTNNIEGFWSLAKRGIDGVHHCVDPKHLQTYMDEYAFRYNHRKDEAPMFVTLLSQVTN